MTGLALLTLLVQSEDPDWLGRTADQVVAMGHRRFYEEFTEKHGETTLAMAGAEDAYGQAVFAVNEKTLAARPGEQRFFAQLRIEATAGRYAAIDCARSLTGGGSMWTPVFAGVRAEVETVVLELLSRKPGSGVAQKSAWDAVARAKSDIEAGAEDIDSMAGVSGMTAARARDSADDLAARLFTAAKLVSGRPEAERRRVFRFFKEAAELVSDVGAS